MLSQLRNEECLHCRFKENYVNTIGHQAAERALQLGTLFSPAEALKVGLVDEVVPEDQVHSKARSVMAKWFTIPGKEQAVVSFGAGGQGKPFLILVIHPGETKGGHKLGSGSRLCHWCV